MDISPQMKKSKYPASTHKNLSLPPHNTKAEIDILDLCFGQSYDLFFPYLWTFGLTCSKTKERSTMLDSVSRFVFFIPVVSNKSWHIIQGQRIDSPDRKK